MFARQFVQWQATFFSQIQLIGLKTSDSSRNVVFLTGPVLEKNDFLSAMDAKENLVNSELSKYSKLGFLKMWLGGKHMWSLPNNSVITWAINTAIDNVAVVPIVWQNLSEDSFFLATSSLIDSGLFLKSSCNNCNDWLKIERRMILSLLWLFRLW